MFLLVSFPAKETALIHRADHFRETFEEGLQKTVSLANGLVSKAVLSSGEIVTKYTRTAECQTQNLTGILIDTEITKAEEQLCGGHPDKISQQTLQTIGKLNRHMLTALNGLIEFKEEILNRVLACKLYTTNYPLLIEHILREAKLYRQILMQLIRNGYIHTADLTGQEIFWNQIMMEHAQFIRGLLDPTECELIQTANGFAEDYCCLLKEAKERDIKAENSLTARTIQTTKQYQQFKTAGTEGITDCKIRSVILPLLADHVLRESNHYLRILEHAENGGAKQKVRG